MKKFDQPFDSYELSVSEKPVTVEFYSIRSARLQELAKNPLYYYYAVQFIGGSLYRAVLGYELVWDSTYEKQLMKYLDFVLTRHIDRKEYYLEEIQFATDAKIHGLKWSRQIKPNPINFRFKFPKSLKAGCRATARINKLDAPSHVDIEFNDGDIFTISFGDYQQFKLKRIIRSLDHSEKSSRPKQVHYHAKDARVRSTRGSKRPRIQVPLRQMDDKVFALRSGFKRTNAV